MNDWNLKQGDYFNKNLERYEAVHDLHFNRVLSHFLKFANFPPKSKLLELGCGSGRYTIPLLKNGFVITGVDLSSRSIETLNRDAENCGVKDRLETVCGSLENFRQKSKFDYVFCIHFLHHVQDMLDIAKKTHLLLNDGGKFVALEPNPYNPYWYFLRYRDWEVEKGLVRCTISNLRNILNNAGFQKVNIESYGAFPPTLVNQYQSLERLENIRNTHYQ